MLRIENLSKFYGTRRALDDVSLHVSPGEIVGLLGRNGAGKSTLMRIITGCFPPSSGDVILDGVRIRDYPKVVKSKIGYLPEVPPLYLDMLVEDYLLYIARLEGVKRSHQRIALGHVLQVCQLWDRRFELIETLSRGYRQRVALAGSLISNPRILILDEPFVGLDPVQARGIRQRLKTITSDRMILFSSHVLEDVQQLCDRVLVLEEGQIVYQGTEADSEKGRSSINMRVPKEHITQACKVLLHHGYHAEIRVNAEANLIISKKLAKDAPESHGAQTGPEIGEIIPLFEPHQIRIEHFSRRLFDLEGIFQQIIATKNESSHSAVKGVLA